jgi:hypothetical protein
VLYRTVDFSAAVADKIAGLKPTQRAYEERRAQKAGKTLEQWFLGKLQTDLLPDRISAFIAACEAFDAVLPILPDLTISVPAREKPALPSDEIAGEDDAQSDDDDSEAEDDWDAEDGNWVTEDDRLYEEIEGAMVALEDASRNRYRCRSSVNIALRNRPRAATAYTK